MISPRGGSGAPGVFSIEWVLYRMCEAAAERQVPETHGALVSKETYYRAKGDLLCMMSPRGGRRAPGPGEARQQPGREHILVRKHILGPGEARQQPSTNSQKSETSVTYEEEDTCLSHKLSTVSSLACFLYSIYFLYGLLRMFACRCCLSLHHIRSLFAL